MLRQALSHAGAVLDLSVDGEDWTPVVVKELTRHAVTGAAIHVDLLRVRLDRPIQATVTLELVGADDAPGVKEGGVLEHVTRELTIEALPTDIPDSIEHDVSEMVIGDTVTLEQLTAPEKVKLMDDPETVIATLTPPRLQVEEEPEIEEETELVGEEGEEAPEGEGEAPAEGESPGRGRRRRVRRRVARAHATARRGGARRLAGRRARQSRAPSTTRTRHNIGFEVARVLIDRWELPKPKAKYRGAADRGTGRRRRAARRGAAAADLHERRRAIGRAGPGCAQGAARARARAARRDRPAVRGNPHPARRGAGGPQRPEIDQGRSSGRPTSRASGSASGARRRPIPSGWPRTC